MFWQHFDVVVPRSPYQSLSKLSIYLLLPWQPCPLRFHLYYLLPGYPWARILASLLIQILPSACGPHFVWLWKVVLPWLWTPALPLLAPSTLLLLWHLWLALKPKLLGCSRSSHVPPPPGFHMSQSQCCVTAITGCLCTCIPRSLSTLGGKVTAYSWL